MNAGQVCIAPDYVLVDRAVQQPLVEAAAAVIRSFYGDDPSRSPDYGRIVNSRHHDRLSALLGDGVIQIELAVLGPVGEQDGAPRELVERAERAMLEVAHDDRRKDFQPPAGHPLVHRHPKNRRKP